MHYRLGATALALISGAQLALAQECPPGYAKSSKVGWVNCPTSGNDALQCATLEVPMDWTKPNGGEKLKLRLVRQPAAAGSLNAKSIIINPGGPGESGIKSVVDGGSGYQDVVGDGFHIIGFDPRGVGLTTPYICPEAAGDVGEYSTDDGLTTAFEYNTAQAKDCASPKYGSDLIGTAFVARDIKAIAEALGEDGLIRYWGYSYGTLLGATLSAMFPSQMDRVILDGNINPTDYYHGLGEEGSTDVDKGVQRFFEQCADAGSPNCAVAVAGQSGKQLQNTFDAFLQNLDYTQAKQVRDAFYKVLYFQSATAFKDFATTLSKYYKDSSTIRRRALTRRQLEWKPDYAEIKTELAISGITCGDVVQRFKGSRDNFKKWLATYEKTSKYGGDIAISLLYQCSVWTVDAREKFTGAFSGIRTKNPILFLNGQYDPVTPLLSAQNSAAGFVGARVLQSSGVGHCTNANESPELNKAIKTYMVEGTFPRENKIYTPTVTNVFRSNAKRTLNGPTLNRRNVEYPTFFENEPLIVKRQNSIPAGCTKVAASSTPVASASASSVAPVSLSSLVSTTASSMASASASSVAPTISSLIVPASPSSSVSAVSATISGGASSASNSATLMTSSASASATLLSLVVSQSAPVFTGVPSSATTQSVSKSDSSRSVASTDSSLQSVIKESDPTSTAHSVTTSVPNHSDSSTVIMASSSSGSVEALTTKTFVASYNSDVIYATTTNSLFSQPSHPSSVGPNGQTYNSYDAKSSSVYGNYPAPSVDFKSYDSYEDSKKTISTPCPTPAWSSQSGHIPLTKTHTTITVQTVTKCSYDKKDCPVNSATPTVLVTETKTAITVVAVPTTTVYVTSIVDVCSTGLQTKTVTVTQTCNKGCISKPTGIPQGYTTTVKYCEACATPSTVTVTFCTACAGTPARPTPPVQVLSVPTASTVSDYNSQAKATPSTFSGYSKPAVGIYSVPSKPSMPSGNNATVVNSVPGSQTPAKTMTLQTSVASTGAYRCSGSACGGVPTSYTPAQFTGAAVHEKANFPFIAPMILAGFAFLM